MLLRDINRGKDKQVQAAIDVITHNKPDILVLRGIDWDFDQHALTALANKLDEAGLPLPHHYFPKPNRGVLTGLDLNGDGKRNTPQDAQGFGAFTGQDGLALMSRFPFTKDAPVLFDLLWWDLPGALLPFDGFTEEIAAVQKLSTTVHALRAIDTGPNGTLWLGIYAATSPVFDGPEDRNGRRNHDETALWLRLLDGALSQSLPPGFVLAGHANLDAKGGDGRRHVIAELLAHPLIQDPFPDNPPTVKWDRAPFQLRVSYVLPSTDWEITGSGIDWPVAGSDRLDTVETASRHRLVWVDIRRRKTNP